MFEQGWYGVDLDGTLAEWTEWVEPDAIGKPIPKMVERVKQWLAAGRDVRIFTARVEPLLHHNHPWYGHAAKAHAAIQIWCQEQFGKVLPITSTKDLETLEIWDDRCMQVVTNTGVALQELLTSPGSYMNPDGSADELEQALISGRVMAGALGKLMPPDQKIVAELAFQPEYPDDAHGWYVVERAGELVITRRATAEEEAEASAQYSGS